MAKRTATVVWERDLMSGRGSINAGSGVFHELPVTWASRTEEPAGKTSPEELLAAAHASCYAMALSGALARAGKPPESLRVSAECSFEKVGDAWRVTTSHLTVKGRVPGMDAGAFEETARAAESRCPISNAIRNNVRIDVSAGLEQ